MNYNGEVSLYGLDLIPTGSRVLLGKETSDRDYIHIGRIPVSSREVLKEQSFYEQDSYLPWVPSALKCFRHYTEDPMEEPNWSNKTKYHHDVDIFEMHPLYYKEYINHFDWVKRCLEGHEGHGRQSYFQSKENYTRFINTRMVRFITNQLSDRVTYEGHYAKV